MNERRNEEVEGLIDRKVLELMVLFHQLKGGPGELRDADIKLMYEGTFHPAVQKLLGSALTRKPYQTLPDPLGEALNSGDGSYRP